MVDLDWKSKNMMSSDNMPSKPRVSLLPTPPPLTAPFHPTDISPSSSPSCSAYEHYLRLPHLRKLWNSNDFPNWKSESIFKPSFHALELTFRFLSTVLLDPRPYANRRQWLRRVESLAVAEVEIIAVLFEDDEDDPTTRGTAPTTDIGESVERSYSEASLLPRLATWYRSKDAAQRILCSVETQMSRCPYTLGLGEANLAGKPILRYDAVCKPSEIHNSLNRAPNDDHVENHENQTVYTTHQIVESWIRVAHKLLDRITERIGSKRFDEAARDCYIVERIWKLLAEIEDLHLLMDPDDFLRLKKDLAMKSATDTTAFCFRSRELVEVTKECRDLKQKGIEGAMKRFFYAYKQVLVVVMGSLEASGNRVDSGGDSLSRIFLEPTYFPSLDAAKTFLAYFWESEHAASVRGLRAGNRNSSENMGLALYQNPKCLQSSLLLAPHSLCHPHKKPPSAIPSLSLRNLSDGISNHAPFRLIHRSSSYNGFMGSRVQRLKPACTAYSGECFDEETMNQSKQYEQDDESDNVIDIIYQVSEIENTQNNTEVINSSEKSSKEQFWMMTKPEVLDPSELGIKPEPPSWPEREKILRLEFEKKVNCLGIPFSIRIIQKKLQWQKNFTEAREFITCCSMKKSFSSMMFIIHELQNYTLQIRQNLHCEDNMQGLITKFRSDVDASCVWLFQKILCKTPNLMVYTMVLLANFTVFSMKNNTVLATTAPLITEARIMMLADKKEQDEDEKLWMKIVEEAYRMQEELRSEALDRETVKQLVAPVSVELEGDTYEEYERTEMCYREIINLAPNNSLLLSNYAQFRYLVYGDVDEAEEYFRSSMRENPEDPETLSRYADFLWLVRKDVGEAEEKYLEAMDAAPGNTHYMTKYAHFIWYTGGQGTCFPTLENRRNFGPVA
ncbi:nematode resistance protein-like HSPRO2 [Senna tora]|uniref:Nematode resistance protein-like HSPRO2 n=1 Tax=Senna tora TaxID=362788 RepID=A0A834WS58_9FABA|nr:nematode resistance protein-like HSPRO2 [Senna tora]